MRAGLGLSLCGVALAVAGCGGSSAPKPAAERLRREDLIAVTRAMATPEAAVIKEVAAAKTAWPQVANGLPADATALPRAPVGAAAQSAAQIRLPAELQEAQAATLTGPAYSIAGLFRTYSGLSTRGWQLTGAAIEQIEHGSPAAARFARENVALYIESVYDGHFELAQVGKKLRAAYRTLGGPAAFGSALTQPEVNALAETYSEANDRLHPHVGVRLGS